MKKLVILALLLATTLFANEGEDLQGINKCNFTYDNCASKCDETTMPEKCIEECDVAYEACAEQTDKSAKEE